MHKIGARLLGKLTICINILTMQCKYICIKLVRACWENWQYSLTMQVPFGLLGTRIVPVSKLGEKGDFGIKWYPFKPKQYRGVKKVVQRPKKAIELWIVLWLNHCPFSFCRKELRMIILYCIPFHKGPLKVDNEGQIVGLWISK